MLMELLGLVGKMRWLSLVGLPPLPLREINCYGSDKEEFFVKNTDKGYRKELTPRVRLSAFP
jgi:hypothetical protein